MFDFVLLVLDCEESGWIENDGFKDELVIYIVNLLKEKRIMLLDYFFLEIDSEGNLLILFVLLDGYVLNLNGFFMFVFRLVIEVSSRIMLFI